MIPTHTEPYQDGELLGELRVGWASWDDGHYQARSIKWAYPNASGKISRGCPELPFYILVDMVIAAKRLGELSDDEIAKIRNAFV